MDAAPGVIDLNADVGEGFGRWSLGDDDGLLDVISSANVACGFHAGDPRIMRHVCHVAAGLGVVVGAQASYPDLAGFGRRFVDIDPAELIDVVLYQVGALERLAAVEGTSVRYVKPHGALYGMAARMEHAAEAVCDAADVYQVPLMGMINTLHESIYTARGHEFIAEFYADLDYSDDGFVIITRDHPPVDTAKAAERCVRAVREGKTTSVSGKDVAVRADAICVHSDTPNAVDIARTVKAAVAPWLDAA